MYPSNTSTSGSPFRFEAESIALLISSLQSRGYTVVGPTVRNGALFHDEIMSVQDLPSGKCDEQKPGSYRLVDRGDKAMFGYAVGPQSFKKFLYPPFLTLFRFTKNNGDFQIVPRNQSAPAATKYAFLGIRPCELSALFI